MIQEIVTFFGAQGHRMAEIGFLATCVVTPFYIVDFIDNTTGSQLTKFFNSEEEAEAAAKMYAFEGIIEDVK
jgi:type III secretory pathway component EscT